VKYSVSELTEAFVEAHAAEWGRLVLMRNEILEYRQISSLPHFKQDELFTPEESRGDPGMYEVSAQGGTE
jgi:hypothetical protein